MVFSVEEWPKDGSVNLSVSSAHNRYTLSDSVDNKGAISIERKIDIESDVVGSVRCPLTIWRHIRSNDLQAGG